MDKYDIRKYNLNQIRKIMQNGEAFTKQMIAENIGVSAVTAGYLFDIMEKENELIADKVIASNGGRPSQTYRYNGNLKLALTIHMYEDGSNDIASCNVINLFGKSIYHKQYTLRDISISNYINIISELYEKYPAIKAAGLCMPGEEVNGNMVICDYKQLEGINLAGELESATGLPVVIENDINIAVEGYCEINDTDDRKCIVGIYFPAKYPPGAGIIINGKIHKGRNGLAGEIKYIPYGESGKTDLWENFDYDNRKKLADTAIKIVLAFNCMYNPDYIILYGDGIPSNLPEMITSKKLGTVESIMMPDISYCDNLNYHCEKGIARYTLNYINNMEELK